MGKLIKKEKTLKSIFGWYLVSIIIGSIIIIGINVIAFNIASNCDILRPANYVESALNQNKASLSNTDIVTKEGLPSTSEFGIYDLKGNYKNGSFSNEMILKAWEAYEKDYTSLSSGRFLYVIPRENEILLITYPISVEFDNSQLQKWLPNIELILVITGLLEILIYIVIMTLFFGKYLGKKILILEEVSKNIENQNLEFTINESNIKEINQVLKSLVQMQNALKDSLKTQWNIEKMKHEQIGALAHDIKTPLTIIKGNCELLGETIMDSEQSSYQKYSYDSANQMEKYINQLVNISKSQKVDEMKREKIELSGFLRALKKQTFGLALTKRINIRWENMEYSNSCFYGDWDCINRGMMNVFENAVDHTPNEGWIKVDVFINKNECVFSIVDSGPGFSKSALIHGKEQFFMDDISRGKKNHFGIGLYSVDMIIKEHQGRLELSNTPDGGCVKIFLKID